ncbi:gamma-glutamylcyclotransferase family protein [Mangrovibacterium lignilyticum]|uniref:gamma-glutamylcyclotransferase family protein n=1 Tax=Mangrovibacterium lignilyticum TaxID=2668052 RepID=UPI0013D3367B|nr:gamma-glutamylcyclotransferase family protein [Mangrovibacterium lignilyticum]
MANPLLFSYGTLSDPEYIQLLLRRLPGYRVAELEGYGLYTHPANGYLFVKPEKGKSVKGQLFELSWSELELIDYWEDVPLYQRELMTVRTPDGKWIETFVYTQPATAGIASESAPEKNRQEILNDIEDFLESMRRGGFFK